MKDNTHFGHSLALVAIVRQAALVHWPVAMHALEVALVLGGGLASGHLGPLPLQADAYIN